MAPPLSASDSTTALHMAHCALIISDESKKKSKSDMFLKKRFMMLQN